MHSATAWGLFVFSFSLNWFPEMGTKKWPVFLLKLFPELGTKNDLSFHKTGFQWWAQKNYPYLHQTSFQWWAPKYWPSINALNTIFCLFSKRLNTYVNSLKFERKRIRRLHFFNRLCLLVQSWLKCLYLGGFRGGVGEFTSSEWKNPLKPYFPEKMGKVLPRKLLCLLRISQLHQILST